jgi:hypothetical protein
VRIKSLGHPSDLWNLSLTPQHVWQRRFYDFVVRTYEKRQEKLHYIHQNPVRASLVLEPWQWRWEGHALVEFGAAVSAEGAQRKSLKLSADGARTFRKARKVRQPQSWWCPRRKIKGAAASVCGGADRKI